MSWKAFDEIAQEYDNWYDRNIDIYHAELSCVESLVRVRKPCLEVGVGTGRFAAPIGVDVGLDAAYRPLIIARSRGIEVVQGRAEQLPFRDSSFSCALMVATLCFLDDRERALGEISRVLKRRGNLYVCIIPSDSPLGKRYSLRSKDPHSIYHHAKFISRVELIDLLRNSGFIPMDECHTLIEEGVPNFLCMEALHPGD